MILGLLGQLFEPVWMEIFLEMFGPISGPKWTDLGSKMDILGPICPKKWKISGKHNKKWMIIVLLGQLCKPVWMEIILELFGPISGPKWTNLGFKIDIFGPICPKKWKISGKHN
jgi:hypothetical protein